MTIKCKSVPPSASLEINKIYKVVAIAINFRNLEIKFNIVDHFQRLAFFPSSLFEVEDPTFESDWVLSGGEDGYTIIVPKCMSYKTFYEDFHNDNDKALALFKDRFPNLL